MDLITTHHHIHIQISIPNTMKKREKRLRIDDKIKIQKVLKNLENYLEKFYHRAFIFQILP